MIHDRYAIVLKRESGERAKVQIRLKQVQAVLAEQRVKVESLDDYTKKAKEYKTEIKRLQKCAGIVQKSVFYGQSDPSGLWTYNPQSTDRPSSPEF